MKRWPFFHIGIGQNWTVGTSANWDLMLAVHDDGTHRWVLRRESHLYKSPEWQLRFSWNIARHLCKQLAGEHPLTSWNESSVFAAPAKTWEIGFAVVSVVSWMVALIVAFVLFLAIGNSE